jgi:stalled ribosome rescue protein Dom34
MATDWVKWHLERIKEAADSNENPHQMLGRIQHSIDELMKFYQTGTLIHHKKRLSMHHDPNEKKEATTPHTVTAEDLANNPDLADAGVKEGDEIGIPAGVAESSDAGE